MPDNTRNLEHRDAVEQIIKLFTSNVRSELIPSDNFIFTQKYFETGQADGLRATSLRMFSDKITREGITAHKQHLNIVCDCLEVALSRKSSDDETQLPQKGFGGYVTGSGLVNSGSPLSKDFLQENGPSPLQLAISEIEQIMPVFLGRLKTAISNNCLDSAAHIDPHVLSLKTDIFDDVKGVMGDVLDKLPQLHDGQEKLKAHMQAEQDFQNQWIASVMYSGPQTERKFVYDISGRDAPNVVPLF